MELSVLIADDHPLFREALKQVVSDVFEPGTRMLECTCFDEARRAIQDDTLELALLDLNMPGIQGLAGVAALRQLAPLVPLAVVSADERPEIVRTVLELGACGFIPKSAAREEMAAAVTAMLAGEIYNPVQLAGRDTASPTTLPLSDQDQAMLERLTMLTRQERCVLGYITNGKSNKVVAIELAIAESTVKAHVSAILRKLGVHSRTQAVIEAGRLLERVKED